MTTATPTAPADDDLVALRLDHLRTARTGIAEAVYAPGKTPEQCAAAVHGLLAGPDTGPVLLTRAGPAQVDAALARHPGGSRTDTGPDTELVVWRPAELRDARVVVLGAGTADLPVVREAAAVLGAYGYPPVVRCDVGVAGLHRLLAEVERVRDADALVVAAGMEGALASVVAGLTAAPVVAVPTSPGYGAGLAGVTALLAMHASCSPGVSVVGIDNGFGAACAVLRILNSHRRTRSSR